MSRTPNRGRNVGVSTFCSGGNGTLSPPHIPQPSSSMDMCIVHKPIVSSEDYDVFVLDSQIRGYINSKKSLLSDLRSDLFTSIKLSKGRDISQRLIATQNIPRLRNQIKDIETTMELGLYNMKVSSLLEEYRSIHRSSFMGDDFTTTRRKAEIRRLFLGNVRDYVVITISKRRVYRTMVCESCSSKSIRVRDDDECVYVCQDCYHEFEIPNDTTSSYKDTDRVNLSNKYVYSRKGHFTDAVKHLQGDQHYDRVKIDNVIMIIKREMKFHGLVSEGGLINSVSKSNIHTFLSENSLSKHYIDLNLIYMLITDVPCPNLSPYIDKLYSEFDQLSEALEKVRDDGRVNSLNVFYILYKLLQRQERGWRKSDFYILKTKAKEDEHDEKMKKAFALLGWEWKPTY